MITQLLSTAQSEEVSGVSDRIISLIAKANIGDDLLTIVCNDLKTEQDELTKVIKRKQANDETKIVWAFEGQRDKGLKCLFNTVFGATFRLNDVIEAHANKLYEVFKRHGLTMYRLQHTKQTATMASMFKELEAPEYQESITALLVQVLIDEVKEADHNFLDSLNNRSYSEAIKEIIRLQGEATKKVREKLEHIVNYMNLLNDTKDESAIKTLYKEIDEVINKANAIIRGRETRKNKE